MAAPRKVKQRPVQRTGPGRGPQGLTTRKSRPAVGNRAPLPSKRGGSGGGIDLGRFAGEVSRNFGRGVAKFGKGVDESVAAAGRGVGEIDRFIKRGGVTGPNGVKRAMDTGADQNNPLHRILLPKAPKR